jgi:hypothetical protein
MKVIAADSAAALLNESFEPLKIVAAAAVLVEPPYREASEYIAEPIFANAENGHALIVHELELCRNLLKAYNANIVHLDISLGAVSVETLSPIQFSGIKISRKARGNLLKILPKIRKISGEITRNHEIQVLAIGKESIPVRIAELTAGAHAVLYTALKALEENKKLILGLPSKCTLQLAEKHVSLHSLIPAEHDLQGSAEDEENVLNKVHIVEMLNPCARGFRALEITPK